MDKLTRYREIIRRELEGYAAWLTKPGEQMRCEVVFDPALDHFELVQSGWQGRRRVHDVIFHLDIIDGKVWVQHDATDRPIVEELVRAGVPKSDIVIGFHPAELRQHTEFAVG
ncbi:MAG TPA: XisI protein [Fimbriiglobus sp.]|nr:XisI protein [Fimbriiglobus sp.]